MITDGKDNMKNSDESLIDLVKGKDLQLNIYGIGEDCNRQLLETLAAEGNGKF